ncbi:transmembrane protein 69 [Kryptolebias marmoratus]|uniref:Transmembrane protein 69 n=1 Tax=Kryptolebias marmoratus TaxID=37003 RepID=A0A3Q3A887_KRYMA|nr:transmembrane protein 69 [Kryptolebias marmoratus]
MIRFSSGRVLISGVPVWRCPQHCIRTLSSPLRARLLLAPPRSSSVSVPHTPASSIRLLRAQSVSWEAPRLCHGDVSQKQDHRLSMRALTKAPKPALYLGLSGLIPFLSAPVLMAASQSFYPEAALAQMVYGASIVSFLGGARWGFAIPAGSPAKPDWRNLGNSVVPSLLAWLALLCRDNVTEGVLVVIMGLGLSLHYDLTLLPGYPTWFKAMRTVLTLVATFSLVATLVLKNVYPEKTLKEA